MARLALLAFAALLAGCGAATAETSSDREELTAPELVEALRGGGHVLYVRHGATDRTHKDTHKTDVSRCDGMRNLNELGRKQSRELGRALEALEIPVGEVRASAFCRTRETAELAFGRYERDEALTGFPEEGDPRYEARLQALRALLAQPPAAGTNTVLVAHDTGLEEAAGRTLAEGEVVVFEPLGGTAFRYRGRIPAAAWPQLAERLRRDP
ncbi:MAG TPA: histidine phosphatase family protein [Gaiellaceae bacterium]|nr:histidine phosphatase family protein [Gaiellaceae bacterium]